MKPAILLLAFFSAIAFSSCTTAYKTGQTPDDVYYSPARPQDEYVQVDKKEKRYYEGSDEYYDDRYLRMKVRDRYRWSDLDEWYYFGNRYSSVYYNNYWNNPWTPYTYWNSTYNPYYYHGVVMVSPKSPTYFKPRTFNLNTYNNQAVTSGNYSSPKIGSSGPRTTYSPSSNNNNSNSGSILRNIFNSNSNNNNSSSSPKTTTSSSSSTGSSSGSSGSSGSAPVRRF